MKKRVGLDAPCTVNNSAFSEKIRDWAGPLAHPSVCLWIFSAFLFVYLITQAGWLVLDYDEYMHAHSSWQISQGFKPFVNFHECHTPIFWMIYAPLVRVLPESFETLLILRLVNTVFSVLCVFILGWMLQRTSETPAGRWAVVAAIFIMLIHPRVLAMLGEWRPDPLGLAMVLGGLAFLSLGHSRDHAGRTWFLSGALLSFGVFMNPKLLLLAMGGTLAAWAGPGFSRRWKVLCWVCVGAAAGLVTLLGWCWAAGISFVDFYQQVFVYHALLSGAFGGKYLLLQQLLADGRETYFVPWLLFLAGVLSMAQLFRSGNWNQRRVHLGFLIFCLSQIFFANLPHKQYTAPLYIVWAGPLALAIEAAWQSGKRWFMVLGLGAVVGILGNNLVRFMKDTSASGGLAEQVAMGNALLENTRPGRPVACVPRLHPVFRQNSTFFWFKSEGGKMEEEDLMQRFPRVSSKFTREGYLSAFEQRPPSLIVFHSRRAGPRYIEALSEFLDKNKAFYTPLSIRSIKAYVRRYY